MFEGILGTSPYQSPTDMGVNMAGNCIIDDEMVRQAAKNEILRRYYQELYRHRRGLSDGREVYKIELLMKELSLTPLSRSVVGPAMEVAEATGAPAAAIELPDGTILTGKTSELLGAASALLLNALKHLGKIPDEVHLISPTVIEPVQDVKVNVLGNKNPLLHIDELLVALSICAVTDPNAQCAMEQLKRIRGSEVHSTVILSEADKDSFRRLGVHLTCEPKYETAKLYHG
jgi:uncharacterized protein (UPF0371 family)